MVTVCVIGAGPSGLASARRLLNLGAEVTIFERGTLSGGTWIYDERTAEDIPISGSEQKAKYHAPPGGCYDSLTTNIVTPLMRFHDYDYPSGTEWFVTREPVLGYIQSFSKDQDIEKHICYDTSVIQVRKSALDGQWMVRTRRLQSSNDTSAAPIFRFEDHSFDAVVIGTGHYDLESIPLIPGLTEVFHNDPFAISHSKSYRIPDPYRDLTVLVIGSGTSAFEVAKDLCLQARQVYLAHRPNKKASGVEKLVEDTIWSILPPQLAVEVEVEKFLTEEEDGTKAKSGSLAIAVKLIDGKILRDIDHVIFCTGYRYTLPFLGPDFHPSASTHPILSAPSPSLALPYRNKSSSRWPEEQGPPSYSAQLQNLHNDIFYIPDPTLSFVGIPIKVRAIPFFDIQALAVAAVLTGKAKLPDQPVLEEEYRHRVERQGGPGKQVHILGKKKEMDAVTEILQWLSSSDQSGGGMDVTGEDYYLDIMKEGDENVVEVTRQFLFARTKVKGWDDEKTHRIINEAIESLQKRVDELKGEEARHTVPAVDKEGA